MTSNAHTLIPVNGSSVYDVSVKEMHDTAHEESSSKKVDSEFREARGREGLRLHVMLKAVNEADVRANSNTRATLLAIDRLTAELHEKATALTHLIETFEATAEKRFDAAQSDLATKAQALTAQIAAFANAETEHFTSVRTQVQNAEQSLWKQSETHHEKSTTQVRESTERITFDLRQARDEIVSLVDSRMNHADASFAALRGDVEVVKFLVMDLIKDRIGRHDPKQKPF